MTANIAGPIWEAVPKSNGVQFAIGDTTTKKTVLSGGTNGSRVDAIAISTNDTTAVNLQFYMNDGSTDFYLGVVLVAIGSGYTTVPRVEGITTLAPALGYLFVPNGYTLKAACLATMTTAKVTDVVITGGDF